MFSFAVKNSVAEILLAATGIILSCAFEEMAPKPFGVGMPFLLMAAVLESSGASAFKAMLFAVACGAAEDAISHLPAMTSVSYFLLAALLTRRARMPLVAVALAYPAYQVWLWMWMSDLGGAVFGRVLMAFPAGAIAAAIVFFAGGRLKKEAAVG